MIGRQGFYPRKNFERQSYGRDTSQISFEEIPGGVGMFPRAAPITKPVSIGGGRQHSINASLMNHYIQTQQANEKNLDDQKLRSERDLSLLGKRPPQTDLETLESKVEAKAESDKEEKEENE